jgi:hypothetical protein
MKRLLILLFVILQVTSYSQAIIGMSHVFSFTPASAGTPLSTVNYGDTVHLAVYVKNSGNVNFNGVITIHSKRDTVGGVFCDTNSVVNSIIAHDSVFIDLTILPTPGLGAFRSAGNGNTIVVWPLIKQTITPTIYGDSVRPVLWINSVNSVREFENNLFKVYPNPVIHDLTIKAQNNNQYKNIIIYDVFARKVKELSFKETIDVSELNAGSYWMIINSEDKSYRINFIKE